MRISVIASLLDRRPSGLGVYTANVVRELSKIASPKHKLTVFTSCPSGMEVDQPATISLNEAPAFLQPRFGKPAALLRFAWTQMFLPFKMYEQDIAYCPTHHGMLWGAINQVVTVHDLLPIRFPSQYRLQHQYFSFVLPKLLDRAAAVIADSQSTKLDIHNYYKIPLHKIFVVHCAADTQYKPCEAAAVRKIKQLYGLQDFLLVVGASYAHKNIERALEAFARAKSFLPGVDLVVAGGRPAYLGLLRQKAEALKLPEVKFLGYVPPEELPALYSAAGALLYPSLYEGFGLPPLEAMACGCPVIVSNTSSLPEVCGAAAYYVDPSSIDSLTEAIAKVMLDDDVKNSLRQKGLERARLFSWENTAMNIMHVLEEVGSAGYV
jgi:glycosyltransferase involved in cell wall biosynthesis